MTKPTKSDTRQRNHRLFIRLTAAESTAIASKATDAGMAVAAFCRAAALGDPGDRARRKPAADKAELLRLLAAVNRVGNNINQIARALNLREAVTPPEVVAALADLRAIRIDLKTALHPGAVRASLQKSPP